MEELKTKADFRKLVKEQRLMLGVENIKELSDIIIDEYCSLDCYKNADVIMPYYSKDLEINTLKLIDRAFMDNKKVAVPKLFVDELGVDYMLFVIINDKTEFKKSKFDLTEPVSDETYYPERDKKIEYIMPGLAFDLKGNRIGYGGGYYDKYLSNFDSYDNIHKVALAFDFQIFDELPCEDFDKKYDMIISENRFYLREL